MPPVLKTAWEPNLQSVTKGTNIFHDSKKIFAYIKSSVRFTLMKKNFDQIFSTIEIDPVTDRYHITIPEEIINEFDWYEDLKLKWNIDSSGDLILTEEID